jgi:hypothetical protein
MAASHIFSLVQLMIDMISNAKDSWVQWKAHVIRKENNSVLTTLKIAPRDAIST